ncbi:rCG38724 [Rattus norvegicus]|uniref:LINE protein n=1 Tax=Rattus norvegicus TaxID=10116 RepID=Q63311_RAT|nr:rCG38724 [Rattus norvegicus]CAA50577.1 LINE [Rattus norvegicus]
MTPAAYVAEGGLVWHQWKDKPLVLPWLKLPSVGEYQGGEAGSGGVWGEGTLSYKQGDWGWDGGLWTEARKWENI